MILGNLRYSLVYINLNIRKCGGIFDEKEIEQSISKLQLKTTQLNFWDNKITAQKILKNISSFENELKMWAELELHFHEVESSLELLHASNNIKMIKSVTTLMII